MSAFVRENQIVRRDVKGEQMKDVELCVMTEGRKAYYSSSRRRVRHALTAPKQTALNDKNAWLYLGRLINMNFGKGDYHLSLTYDEKYLPASAEDAKRDFERFIGKVKKLYEERGGRRNASPTRKRGVSSVGEGSPLPKLRYIMVMSYSSGKDGEPVRLHMHVIMSGGVDRTEIELLWRAPDKPGRCRKDATEAEKAARLGAPLGFADCDRLQVQDGLGGLCAYLAKQPREGIARRWYASVGLRKPYTYAPNDDKYDFHDLRQIVERNADTVDVAYWERRYPGWTVCDPHEYAYSCTDSEFSGISLRVKLRRLTDEELRERRKGGRRNASPTAERNNTTVGDGASTSRQTIQTNDIAVNGHG